MGVYGGSKKGGLVDETTAINPRTYYSIAKMRGEEHISRLMAKENIDTIILRGANVYGYSPTIRFDSVINKFLFDAHFKGRIQIHGSGKQSRPFISLRKLVEVLGYVGREKVEDGTYNVVDFNDTLLNLVDIFKE